jgi:putative ABC transport system ATP-binding protein/lipoprotein-releasing system ATP-binding protein
MSDPLVRAEDLRRSFGAGEAAVMALSDATFQIAPGDHIALIGPSGSGKSTLLHLVAAIDRPTSGVITWPALGQPETLRPGPVSIAFQGPSLLPPLTVLENVELPLLLLNWPQERASAAATALIERLRIADVAEKLPEELSGGQLQRAGLARALVGEPRLVLADEPTGQQDRETARLVVDALFEETGRTGTALLVATHDRAVAERFPIRWTMRDGVLSTETGVVASSS